MAEGYEKLFNSIKPLCAGYIEATHLLPHMSFIRPKAGSICKAHKKSSEEGFQVMYDALIQSTTEDKWDIYYVALKEAEFNSICKLYVFMKEQADDFNSYCNIFEIFSTEITEGHLNIITFANDLNKMETIHDSQLKDIELAEKIEGTNSAAILLFSYFPSTLSYLMKDLDKYLKSLDRNDLLKKIQEAVPVCEDKVNYMSNDRSEMIMHFRQLILETVHPRDIWPKLVQDLGLPSNSIDYTCRRDIEKVMDKFEADLYPGKSQSLYEALSEAGYEILCLKIDGGKCNDDINNYYKKLLEVHHKILTEKIKVSEILESVLVAKVINKRDKDEIAAVHENKGDITAAQYLLEILPYKKNLWHKDFFEILCKNKQRGLVNMIDPEYNYNSDAEADTDSDTNLDTNHGKNAKSAFTKFNNLS